MAKIVKPDPTYQWASAATVIGDTALADDAEITIDIDQIGDGTNITEYINGVAAAISRLHSNWSSIDRFLTIGHDFKGSMTGYISNFRFSSVVL